MDLATLAKRRRQRRFTNLGILLAVIVVTALLISRGHIEVLYLLATLGVTALLIIVAKADLHGESAGR